jgi:cell wall-associated NlpC family hydrolase
VGRGTVVAPSELGQRLVARALELKGVPYVWGGESTSGMDCSGLIYLLLLENGADASGLPRRASTQMAGLGVEVSKEQLEPGDLVFFTTYKAGASHVGVYLGDGDFVHASSAQGKVTISNMSEGYYKRRFVGARRVTEADLRG